MNRATNRSSLKTPILAGIAIASAFFAALGGWSASAPLASAAIAPGVIIPEGNRKTVQHLEGGIVETILVREGSIVTGGDPLIRLDETQTVAEHQALKGRWRATKASELRLLAERAGADRLTVPADLGPWLGSDGGLGEQLAAEQASLDARRAALADQVAVLLAQIEEEEEAIRGFNELSASQRGQIALLDDELTGMRHLFKKGLITKPRLLALERARLQVQGQLDSNQAQIARSRQKIAAAQKQIAGLESARTEEVATELAKVQMQLAVLEEQQRAVGDRLSRLVIRAPVSGTVVALQMKTAGGVVTPGQPLMDIVPAGEELIIEARVSPLDIDEVHSGLPAQVQLLAYKSRNLPRIDGVVRKVSADRLVDEKTGEAYFVAQVAVDLTTLPQQVVLSAGMPAETLILTGSRTALQYLLQPVTDVLRRGLRES